MEILLCIHGILSLQSSTEVHRWKMLMIKMLKGKKKIIKGLAPVKSQTNRGSCWQKQRLQLSAWVVMSISVQPLLLPTVGGFQAWSCSATTPVAESCTARTSHVYFTKPTHSALAPLIVQLIITTSWSSTTFQHTTLALVKQSFASSFPSLWMTENVPI